MSEGDQGDVAEQRRHILDRLLGQRRGESEPSAILCTDIGCWQPENETWQEFLERKGADPPRSSALGLGPIFSLTLGMA